MNASERSASDTHPGRLEAIAAVHSQLAEMDVADGAVAEGLRMRSARAEGRSRVYTVRLDSGEVAALERRAAARGPKPTVLARNLVRVGLAPRESGDLLDALDRIAAAVEDLRALVGSSSMRSSFD
jgi:hypothetical protein